MKLLPITTLVAAAIFSFTSCNKQYNTETSDSQTGTNNNGTGGSGSSSGGFNWTGTAPFSVKIDGVAFVPQSVATSEAAGYISITGSNMDGTGFVIGIPSASGAPGKVTSSPTPGVITYYGAAATNFVNLIAYPGKVKIVTNDATTIEGYFYGEMIDASGLNPFLIHATEGYFKITKP